MANALQKYVEKFILNPNAGKDIDEDGQEIESGQVVDRLTGAEAPSAITSVSKLRMRNAALLSDKDPKYRGAKVSRKAATQDDEELGYDHELAKLCMVEASESEDEDGINEDNGAEEQDNGSEEDDGSEEEDIEYEEDEEQNIECEESEEEQGPETQITAEEESEQDDLGLMSDNEDDNMDYNQFADSDGDVEDEEADDSDGDDDEDEDNSDEDIAQKIQGLKKLMSDDDSDEIKKANAIQHQLGLFDSLFAMRIMLQKLMISSKQFPQSDVYPLFCQQQDLNFNKNLKKTRKNLRSLMSSMIELQDLVLKRNAETRHIVTGKKAKLATNEGSDEEITSSEDEDASENEEEDAEVTLGKKRKLNVEECDEHLKKRFAGLVPYRDAVYDKWYEKTKLLSSHKNQNKFEKFEISALQQLKNILNDKAVLIKRTQLSSAVRGNTARTLGKLSSNEMESIEEYDPEIFDDSDFYKRMLEDVVKSKVALSDNMVDVSRKWIEIQNLRKKVKKNVNTKASKGRKTRFDVMSKMQQFMVPCHHSTMDNVAINTLFRSLFGNSLQKPASQVT